MRTAETITVAEVRRSIRTNIPMVAHIRWFGRPLANVVTPYFHRRGWTANGLTVARMILGAGGVSLLAVPVPWLWPVSAAIYYVCVVLDCVDGNLARIQDDASYLGKFLDGIGDFIYPLAAAFLAGVGCWLYFDNVWGLVAGGAVSIAAGTNQMLRSRLSFMREWMVNQSGPLTDAELSAARGPRRVQEFAAAIMVDGHFVLMCVLFVPTWGLPTYIALAVAVQFVPDIAWTGTTFAEARALLRRKRQSRHARTA